MSEANPADSALASLDWHQSRRTQGLPTISVLIGPHALGLRSWRAWCSCRHRPLITTTTLARAAVGWLRLQIDLRDRVLDWLFSKLKSDECERLDLARMTPYDLD
jgi:hypothetical protein